MISKLNFSIWEIRLYCSLKFLADLVNSFYFIVWKLNYRFALIYQLSKDAVKKPKVRIPDSGLDSSTSDTRKKSGEKIYHCNQGSNITYFFSNILDLNHIFM